MVSGIQKEIPIEWAHWRESNGFESSDMANPSGLLREMSRWESSLAEPKKKPGREASTDIVHAGQP